MLPDTGGFIFHGTGSVIPAITMNDDIYPFTNEIDIVTDDPNIEKRAFTLFDGSHFVRTTLAGMTITIQGDILANDSSDYFTKRQNLINCLRGVVDPTTYPYRVGAASQFHDGWIQLQWVGSSEDWDSDYVFVQAVSIPRQAANGPARTPFMITFWSPTPYWYGDITGNVYFDS